MFQWIIRDMLPTITTESEVLRAFLNYLNPQFKLPSRKKLGNDIKHMSARAKNELTQIMSKQDYLATTADSWSSHNWAFIGSTVSWLDKATLERTTAVLGMKEVKESQTAEYSARSLSKLHEDFSISSKILCTTTDNGTNYVSAFVNFAQEDVVIQPGEDKPDEELADEPQVISMEEALDQADEAEVSLPKHQRCGAHTLNLLASEDVSKVPQWNHGGRNIFRRSAAKAQSLWNAQGRRTAAANEIKDAIGKKLIVPGATRWNSSYDSYKMLSGLLQDLDTRKKINDLCTSMRPNPIPVFVDEDNEVIAEYVKVMAPIANALDKMQSDQHAYMGNFLPNLMVLQRDLNLLRDNSIKHAKPLVTYLLGTQEHHSRDKKGFTERFQHMFEDQEKLLVTAFHPRFGGSQTNVRNKCSHRNFENRVRYSEVGNPKPAKIRGSGRPQKNSKATDNLLKREVRKNPRVTAAQLKESHPKLLENVSVRTVMHRLQKDLKLPSRTAARKPLLTDHLQKARLAFAKQYAKWTKEEWSKVMWSDESTFQLILSQHVKVRRPSTASRYDVAYTSPTVKH
ncbi:uncharacterized protein LOC143023828 [Oratosquilla oratoria]|uniref:uncharacterized protein LOC143023828 n=1 Tax=Oratosquilla oratoria TaxID=337810 RepID=UPI003F75E604